MCHSLITPASNRITARSREVGKLKARRGSITSDMSGRPLRRVQTGVSIRHGILARLEMGEDRGLEQIPETAVEQIPAECQRCQKQRKLARQREMRVAHMVSFLSTWAIGA